MVRLADRNKIKRHLELNLNIRLHEQEFKIKTTKKPMKAYQNVFTLTLGTKYAACV